MDGFKLSRHCERSEAIEGTAQSFLDCVVGCASSQ